MEQATEAVEYEAPQIEVLGNLSEHTQMTMMGAFPDGVGMLTMMMS